MHIICIGEFLLQLRFAIFIGFRQGFCCGLLCRNLVFPNSNRRIRFKTAVYSDNRYSLVPTVEKKQSYKKSTHLLHE